MKNRKKCYNSWFRPNRFDHSMEIVRKGLNVTIIEKNSNSGGLCRSWDHNGFILDTGPHFSYTRARIKSFEKILIFINEESFIVKMCKVKVLMNFMIIHFQ